MTLAPLASTSYSFQTPSTGPSEEERRAYRESRASTNSSYFSHESHGPQTPRADSGLSLVIGAYDDQEFHSQDRKSEGWWADLTPRVPQVGSPGPDADVCVDDSPTLPDISIALLKHFPRPPAGGASLAPPQHPYPHPSGSGRKSESTETLHAEILPRGVTPPRTKPPERPLPLDPEKLAEVNRALRDLGLQELASASIAHPPSPRQSGRQARRPTTPSDYSDNASLRSSKSARSLHSIAPSIPGRTSSRRTPRISSRASSLKLVRSPYGAPIEPSFPRSSSALSGLSRFTSSSDSYAASSLSSASGSSKSAFRSPRSSYRNSSVRSIHSSKLPSIFELPRDLDLVPTGEWALRETSPYLIYGASKSTPDLHAGRDMSLRQKLKHRRLLGGSPPLDGSSFIDLGEASHRWRSSPLRVQGKEGNLPLEERLAALKARLLLPGNELAARRNSYTDTTQDFFSPVADSPPQLEYVEPPQKEESLFEDVRAMVEAKGWDWPAPPDFSAPGPDIQEAEVNTEDHIDHSDHSEHPELPEHSSLSPSASGMTSSSPLTTISSLAPAPSAASESLHEPITPSQTHSSTFSASSLPHTPHTPGTPGTPRSSIRTSRAAPAAAMDLSEELDAIDQAEAERIAEEAKAKEIANGTYVDLTAPRARAIGFSAPATSSSSSGSEESAPSIQKAKMKKEGATPAPAPTESKGGLKLLRGFRKGK